MRKKSSRGSQERPGQLLSVELTMIKAAVKDSAGRALEVRIGVALFIRTTRSVGLTEAGKRFHDRAKPAFEELYDRYFGKTTPLAAVAQVET